MKVHHPHHKQHPGEVRVQSQEVLHPVVADGKLPRGGQPRGEKQRGKLPKNARLLVLKAKRLLEIKQEQKQQKREDGGKRGEGNERERSVIKVQCLSIVSFCLPVKQIYFTWKYAI